jgi:hypothetical protein
MGEETISKERETSSLSWHSVTDRKFDENWDHKNGDGDTEAILEFIGAGFRDPTQY